MSPSRGVPDDEPPPTLALHDRAMDNLRYIRKTMERAGAFTAVSGWAGTAMGLTALAAAALAHRQPTAGRWLVVWLAEAALAAAMASAGIVVKSRRAGMPLRSGPGLKFAWGLLPPLATGAVLTAALYHAGATGVLPAAWLLLYGAGVVSGGSVSVRAVPVMGVGIMLVGVAAALTPAAWGDAWMAAGFGALQLAFGVFIAWRYGG